MFFKWLHESIVASVVLLIFRLYVGYHWITAGWEKLTGDEAFSALGFLKFATSEKMTTGENPSVQGWWASFLENVAIPNIGLFSFLVEWGELLIGIALILGIFTNFAATMGALMNFAFMLSGSTSINPQMLFLTLFIIVAGRNSGRIGLDRFLFPYYDKRFKKS